MIMGLSVAGTIAVVLAALITFGMAAGMSMFTMRAPSGPDAMGLAGLFFAYVFAWILILVAALIASGRGSFAWISGVPGLPTLAVIVVTVGLAIVCMVAAGVSMETRFAWRTAAGLAGALAMPMAVMGFLLALLWMDPATVGARAWPRAAGWTFAGLALIAYVWCGVMWIQSQHAQAKRRIEAEEESRKEQVKWQEQAKQKDVQDAANLAAMPDDAPLRDFVRELFIDRSEAHHQRALERIGKLPNLTARIAELLADALPIQREYCSNYIRHAPKVDPAWAPAFAASIDRLAADYRAEAKDRSKGLITHTKGLTWGAALSAQRFEGIRFDTEMQHLRAALETWEAGGERDEAIGLIDVYLKGERVPD